MTALSRFARLLGLPAHQAEDALHSERAARHVLSRRSFFGVGATMVAGTAFGFAPPEPNWLDRLGVLYGDARLLGESDDAYRQRLRQRWTRPYPRICGPQFTWANIEIRIDQKLVLPVTEIEYA